MARLSADDDDNEIVLEGANAEALAAKAAMRAADVFILDVMIIIDNEQSYDEATAPGGDRDGDVCHGDDDDDDAFCESAMSQCLCSRHFSFLRILPATFVALFAAYCSIVSLASCAALLVYVASLHHPDGDASE